MTAPIWGSASKHPPDQKHQRRYVELMGRTRSMTPVQFPQEEAVVVVVAKLVQTPERPRLDLLPKAAVVDRSWVWPSVHARQAGDVAEKSRV